MTCHRRLRAVTIVAVMAVVAVQAEAAATTCGVSELPAEPGSLDVTLAVTGTPAKQTLILNVSQFSTQVYLDCNGNNRFTDPGDVNGVTYGNDHRLFDIRLGGSDVITFNVADDLLGAAKDAEIVLGPGTNTVNITSTATTIAAGSRVLVDVVGGTGADTVTASIGSTINGSNLLVRADLGTGNDRVNLAFPGTFTNGAIVGVEGVLGAGSNTFSVPKTGAFDASTMTVDVDGGPGADTVVAFLGSPLGANARYFVNADLGAGNDTFTGSLDFSQLQIGAGSEVHFRARGGLGNDTLSVTRNGTTGNVGGANGILDVDLTGGAGNDTIAVDLAGNSWNPAPGTLRLRADGGAGNDAISIDVDAVFNAPVTYDASVTGGPGNDALDVSVSAFGDNPPVTFGPAGTILVDGGLGINTCTVGGNLAGQLHKRNCGS